MAKEKLSITHSPILWLEGRWSGNPNFVSLLQKKGFYIDTVSTGKGALERLTSQEYDLVVVNAASMRTSGARICNSLRETNKELPIILICNPEQNTDALKSLVNYVLHLPFTTRKLVNRIMPLLPGDEKNMHSFGPMILDESHNQVRCNGKKTTLTPRLLRLLMILIENKGEVVDREELFKIVWRTNYTGDTRTLDVHISWLRQAIESDPRNPEIIKTIRGVGYRLDI
ncbi:MAG: response regulator transcription factor [Chloroflexota bacterium]